MTFEQFHNGLRLLRSIDLHELQAEGLWVEAKDPRNDSEWKAWEGWMKFRDNPHDFLIRCDDETAAKIWAVMVKRGATK